MGSILLQTKLHRPPLRSDRVIRARLQQRLEQGLRRNCMLTLVCAPAGFGKTTLVSEWLAAKEGLNAAWLLIDSGDNDLFVFLQYLCAALKKISPAVDESAVQKLNGDGPAEDVLSAWINELAEQVRIPSVLVLEDYHFIQNPAIHEAVAFFLDHAPAGLHVLITTRQDPLLPLSRWRARAQVNEIRSSDLRFTGQEAADFFKLSLGQELPAEDIAVLEGRTEGWIAGLQLAAITIKQEKEGGSPSGFVQALAGENRYVMDYLMDEVLSRQPGEVQSFLLQTSILTRMCASLCAALCDQEDAADPARETARTAAAILAYLDRSNLFLIALDQQREWYRYHHLFAQLLKQRLMSEQGETAVAKLHMHAARWFAAQGLTQEAVLHAAEAKNFDWLADFLEKTLQKPAVWSRGEVNQLVGWLNILPENLIEARPFLCMQAARSLHITGNTPAGIRWLQKAESSLAAQPDSPQLDRMRGIAAANWATFHVMLGDEQQAIESAEIALNWLPPEEALWRARALHAMALAKDALGDLRTSRLIYEQVIELAKASGNLFLALSTTGNLASVLNRLGSLRQAEACCRQALDQSKVNGQWTPAASLALMALAMVHYERNELEYAEKTILEAASLAEAGGVGLATGNSDILSMLCWTRLAQGNLAGAVDSLQRIDAAMILSSRSWLQKRLAQQAIRAHLALDFGELHSASAWARTYEESTPAQFNREDMDIVLARVYRAVGQADKALAILERVLPEASRCGRGRNRIEVLILLALAYSAQKQAEQARSCLLQAVELAAPEGYVRIFVAEGEPLRVLLKDVCSPNLPKQAVDFIGQLLVSFPALPAAGPGKMGLVEALTGRELEVVTMLAGDRTLSEIAKVLYLSPNTLKAHTNAIYAKLGVHSRLQAVNKARELRLISA